LFPAGIHVFLPTAEDVLPDDPVPDPFDAGVARWCSTRMRPLGWAHALCRAMQLTICR